MKTEQCIAIMKALADPSRLAIINSLLERSQYVEEIAKRHALAPSTVSFHLRKLEQAGLVSCRKEQYYQVISANVAILDTTLRDIVSAVPEGRELQDGRIEEYRSKVLSTFFKHGKLDKLPAQQKKRLIVLEQFALRFEPEVHYSEQEVTELISPLFTDYCTIRRLLVDEKLILREGATYWRERKAGEAESQEVAPIKGEKGSGGMSKEAKRAEIKRIYKQNSPAMGVYQILNVVNGKIYIDSSANLEGARNSRMFQLKMGKIVFSRDLQKELNEYGPDSFEFSVLEHLEKPEPGADAERLLAELELKWLEKLQPFGERGYNSARGFQRNKTQYNMTGS
jgi:DNA-binding HxlR family transcriptional regulator